jgi:lipopolysaccharide transport protein LptA
MACSHPERARVLVLTLALCALAPGAPAQDRRQQPIALDAASSEVDYRTNRVVFTDVVITQGEIRVAAERAEATGLNFENSSWTFTGNVRMRVENEGDLQSDRATMEFRDNRMARATITGSPALFSQQRTADGLAARGRAGVIDYEVGPGTVRLRQDAWLTDGRNEITGPLLVYDVREERVQATSAPGGEERVRITILPREGAGEQPRAPADGAEPPP